MSSISFINAWLIFARLWKFCCFLSPSLVSTNSFFQVCSSILLSLLFVLGFSCFYSCIVLGKSFFVFSMAHPKCGKLEVESLKPDYKLECSFRWEFSFPLDPQVCVLPPHAFKYVFMRCIYQSGHSSSAGSLQLQKDL